jgi:hypothetical protein
MGYFDIWRRRGDDDLDRDIAPFAFDELERPRPNSTKRLVKEGHADAE